MVSTNKSHDVSDSVTLQRGMVRDGPHLKRSGLPAALSQIRQAAAAFSLVRFKKALWRRPRALLRRSGITGPHSYLAAIKEWVAGIMPKKLYPRALVIIIAPIVLLESVVAYVFMERHWLNVTNRLSKATVRDVAALIEVYKEFSKTPGNNNARLIELARDRMGLQLSILPPGDLPTEAPSPPFFELLSKTLKDEIDEQIKGKYPVSIDTVGNSKFVEIQVKLEDAVLKFLPRRSRTYASNSHIFLLWMIGSSIVLLTVAILFLGNQIKPILRLSEAAEAFGKGQPVPEDFRPRGAQEVRQAAQAFIDMSNRISTHVEQRTTMLAGVSHDLRTILTRFKLALTILEDKPEAEAINADILQMQHILEDYLAFARGDGGEEAAPADIQELLLEVCDETYFFGSPVDLKIGPGAKGLVLTLKRLAFKRALTNLISNAASFGSRIAIKATANTKSFRVSVEDNGPGIDEKYREEVFKPFYRIDQSRNQHEGHTGLGLAIARDIARSHGGDVELDVSPDLKGLRATIRVPR